MFGTVKKSMPFFVSHVSYRHNCSRHYMKEIVNISLRTQHCSWFYSTRYFEHTHDIYVQNISTYDMVWPARLSKEIQPNNLQVAVES